jgi:eukaryotic-like serine/threonine-protein kinase
MQTTMETSDTPPDASRDLRQPTTAKSPDSTLITGHGGPANDKIGVYRLLEMIGEGGMGEVWLAEQKTPVLRTVALKLIKVGMDTKTVVARFESERQALALMDHSNIAQVYDAGSTPEGRPYFVMEYVPGLPITEFCDKRRLTMQRRLELFQQVCDAVQHAHQKAIIHRDLKPSNILVVEQGNRPIPKIIDFGLAKAAARRLTDKTLFTEMGALVGTPEYMSPEQADLREQNIDTRTDVYSLGVVLYELLVGALPFDAKALRAAGLEAILRVIRDVEPPKPSTKVRSMGHSSAATAEKRREEPRSFARHLQGDLDWITLKALEKDRTRRYGTASELAADIARYLKNEPVLAGPATAGYRIRKYAARHRLALGAATALAILTIGFLVAQGLELHHIRIERDRANRERDRANRVTDFMTGMFNVSDPSEARGNTITAREILDRASTQIDSGLAKDPELQAQMMYAMGVVYEKLGLYSRAQPLLERALNGLARVHGPRNPDTLQAADFLAWLLYEEGHNAQAEKLERETLEVRRQVLGPENLETLSSMRHLAATLEEEGRNAESEKLDREVLDVERRVIGPDEPQTLMTAGNLAFTLFRGGHYPEAEQLDRHILDIELRKFGPDNPDTLKVSSNLADVLDAEGHYPESEKLFRETLDSERRVLGLEHPNTLLTMISLASVLEDEGHYTEAEKFDRDAIDINRRVLGADHPNTALATYNLACVLTHLGRRAEALSLLRQAVDHGLSKPALLAIGDDSDLKSLHGDPQFTALVAHAKELVAAAQKSN